MEIALRLILSSQFSIKTNELLDFLRVFWDNRTSPTETHDEYRDCQQY